MAKTPEWKINWLVSFAKYYTNHRKKENGHRVHTDKQIAEFFLMEQQLKRRYRWVKY